MKNFFLILFLLSVNTAKSQATNFDSLKTLLANTSDAQLRFRYLNNLAGAYMYSFPDSAFKYVQQEIMVAKALNSDSSLAIGLIQSGIIQNITGNFPQAIYYGFESLKVAERSKSFIPISTAYYYLSSFHRDAGDYNRSVLYSKKAKSLFESNIDTSLNNFKNPRNVSFFMLPEFRYVAILLWVASTYEKLDRIDSALLYAQKVKDLYPKLSAEINWSSIPFVFGNIYTKKGSYTEALNYYRMGISIATKNQVYKDIIDNCNGIANVFRKIDLNDSTIYFAMKALDVGRYVQYSLGKLDALTVLADIYKSKNNTDSAMKYLELLTRTKDSLFSQQKIMQIQSITLNEQIRQQDEENQAKEFKERLRTYFLFGGLLVFLIAALLLYRNNRQKHKANIRIEKAYDSLKTTQQQLIQSEKMASLGELTAGIAHEIQNPLNFVNNFSEVNKELLEEMKEEIDKGNMHEVKSIANDVIDNQEKINFHGKRADAIVKGMLQHSRAGSGQKELTGINDLADEYLRLAYHGLRAKDKSFNAKFETDFDSSVGKVSVAPQDIGRAILNLITNAFYSVNEKKKHAGESYEPSVTVSTKKINDTVRIKVRDNGNGVPQKVVDKVFQPFFTTKPTGQGTGLGLSLSYDIITKGHGGELRLETKEGEFAEFIISLPYKS